MPPSVHRFNTILSSFFVYSGKSRAELEYVFHNGSDILLVAVSSLFGFAFLSLTDFTNRPVKRYLRKENHDQITLMLHVGLLDKNLKSITQANPFLNKYQTYKFTIFSLLYKI